MVTIKIRLVGEKEEPNDPEFDLVVDAQIGYEELKKQIQKVTSIPFEFQNLQFHGAQLPVIPRPIETIQFGESLLVKHAFLPEWTALTKTVALFGKTKDSGERRQHYQLAKDYMQKLIDSNFFVVYAKLNERYINIHKTFFKYYDRRPEAIQNTAKSYFEKMLMGKNPTFFFADKIEGTRAGTICTIKYGETIEKYYLKTNHDAGRSGSPSREKLDMREFFIYRCLERLGIGATIHFPSSVIGSKSLLYIASREIPEFKTLAEVEKSETNFIRYVDPTIQILTIYTVLSIGDCHSSNVGVDNKKSPFIVDFFLHKLGIDDLEQDFRNRVRDSNQINKRVNEYAFKDRVKIGVDFLKKVDFEKNIDGAYQYFIEKDKRSFQENDLYFPLNTDEDLKQYLEVVKTNVNKFLTYGN